MSAVGVIPKLICGRRLSVTSSLKNLTCIPILRGIMKIRLILYGVKVFPKTSVASNSLSSLAPEKKMLPKDETSFDSWWKRVAPAPKPLSEKMIFIDQLLFRSAAGLVVVFSVLVVCEKVQREVNREMMIRIKFFIYNVNQQVELMQSL